MTRIKPFMFFCIIHLEAVSKKAATNFKPRQQDKQNDKQNRKMRMNNIHEPFNVPEGYFDNLTTDIMSRLPEQPFQPISIKREPRRRWMTTAAAVAVVIVMSAVTYVTFSLSGNDGATQGVAAADPLVSSESTVEDVIDYAMLDHQDLYAILTE